ncbi:hypothetical protein [Kitasatospora sp. NPDC004289]
MRVLHRRHLFTASALALAALLTACGGPADSGPAAPRASVSPSVGRSAAAAFDPEVALAKSAGGRYSAEVAITSATDGETLLTGSGTMNLGERLSGRIEMRASEPDESGRVLRLETVMTEDGSYGRDLAEKGPWLKVPGDADSPLSDFRAYVRALAGRGPDARKGVQRAADGTSTLHLAGRFEARELAALDPRAAGAMASKGVDGFDCDLWIDQEGRLVRYVQKIESKGHLVATVVEFKNFGASRPVTAPELN